MDQMIWGPEAGVATTKHKLPNRQEPKRGGGQLPPLGIKAVCQHGSFSTDTWGQPDSSLAKRKAPQAMLISSRGLHTGSSHWHHHNEQVLHTWRAGDRAKCSGQRLPTNQLVRGIEGSGQTQKICLGVAGRSNSFPRSHKGKMCWVLQRECCTWEK